MHYSNKRTPKIGDSVTGKINSTIITGEVVGLIYSRNDMEIRILDHNKSIKYVDPRYFLCVEDTDEYKRNTAKSIYPIRDSRNSDEPIMQG